MNEFTWERFWASVVSAFFMKLASIPPAVGPMVFLMFTDLVLGAGLALQQRSYENKKLGAGILKKVAVFFMLGGLSAVTSYAFKLDWDPAEYFVRAVTIYEFLSCCAKYRGIGGPGSAWIDRFSAMVQTAFEKKMPLPTQDQISAKLVRSKDEGEHARL